MIQRRALMAAPLLAMPSLARAQAWPSRPVRIVLAYPPGGSTDVLARTLAAALQEAMPGSAFVVDNRPGASAQIGTQLVASAKPDGYTLLINSSLATVPAMVSRMPYNTLTDFEGVAVAGFSPHLLVVNPRVEARTAQEFVALLRANPGRFNYASAGIGSGPHIAGLLFMNLMNVQVETVHYRGGGPGVAAMVSGEAHFGTPTMASSVGQVRGGNLRALAVLSDQRSPALPDVPSAPEAGMPGVVFEEFFPIVAPRGTPPEAIATLGAAFRQAIQQTAARLNETTGVTPRAGYETSAQVMAFVREGVEKYTRILRAAGIDPE
jgi:tripartite-type tricarboxylate transporter receptor subunit TctC